MKALLQRVSSASVTVGDDTIASIGQGLLVLVGVAPEDDEETVAWMADRIAGLRIFADDLKPMNRNVVDVAGEILLVSQFTLTADTSRGRRPSFTSSAPPEQAERFYTLLGEELGKSVPVQTGEFGADMQVQLVNDGPVTFMLER